MRIDPQILKAAIMQQAPGITNISSTINKPALLCAIADNESSFGDDCNPRLEASYIRGSVRKYLGIDPTGRHGKWYEAEPWEAWGILSAMSHGPTQIMGTVLWGLGYKDNPAYLGEDVGVQVAVQYTVAYINARANGAQTVEQVADAYNSGSYKDRFVPQAYVNAFKQNYDRWLEVFG